MSFSAQLNAFVQGSKDKIDKTVKGATVTLLTRVITETPVDEGGAKGNWQTSVGAPKSGVIDRLAPGGRAAIDEMNAAVPDEAGSVVFMSNNLPYIRKLEYEGHSKQSPAGMVRVNAVNWKDIVEAEAAKHK